MRALLVSFVAVAACSSSKGPGGDGGSNTPGVSDADKQQDSDDLAAALGVNLSQGELAANLDVVLLAYNQLPAGFTRDTPNHVIGTRGGLTMQYDYYCRPQNELMDIPCDGLEDHEHIKVAESGSIASASASMSELTRTAEWTVRNVSVNKPRVDGKGTMMFTSDMATGTYDVMYSDLYTRVRYTPAPTIPSMGTIDFTLTVHRTRNGASPADRDFTAMAQLAVTAPDAATLTFDGTTVYNVTLSTGAAVRAN